MMTPFYLYHCTALQKYMPITTCIWLINTFVHNALKRGYEHRQELLAQRLTVAVSSSVSFVTISSSSLQIPDLAHGSLRDVMTSKEVT